MPCRPGSKLRIAGVEDATASAILTGANRTWVLTAGHACANFLSKAVQYQEKNGTWHDLGDVFKVKFDSVYDAGAIAVSATAEVSNIPVGFAAPLSSFPFVDLDELPNRACQCPLGGTNFEMSGTITLVHFGGTDSHAIEVTPVPGEPSGTNGDSGSPLIVNVDGQLLLAGIFTELKGTRVMQFLHPTPALNAMELPIP